MYRACSNAERGRRRSGLIHLVAVLVLLAAPNRTIAADAVTPCRITVVDAENGWPVPLVELRTVHNVTFVTDNADVIAFDLPELMGRETWFNVAADGRR
jgi:hypothetical protein